MAARDFIAAVSFVCGLAFSPSGLADEGLTGTLSAQSRERRLASARELLRLKNAPAAATLLWDVVAAGPAGDELGYREALYSLAEALYQQGEFLVAQRLFTQLVDLSPPSPNAPAALVRLLELAIELGNDERSDEFLDRLSKLSDEERPPAASYTAGRFLLLRKRYQDSRAALTVEKIPAASPYAVRARYLSGAAAVGLGKLDDAEAEYSAIIEKPLPNSDDERRAVELSQMALGRIYSARAQAPDATQKESEKAHGAYLHISQKSDLFRDAIYEAAWSAIRTHDYERAEQALALLLLAYRDAHETSYAATEAKMLLGNLLLRRGEPDLALDWFEKARTDAEPIAQALAEKLAKPDPEQLSSLVAEKLKTAPGFDLAELVPPAALPLLRADAEVSRFLALQADISALFRAIDEVDATLLILEKQSAATPEAAPEIAKEREAASGYRQALSQVIREAAQLGGALLAAAGQAAHKKFAEVLLRAEAGALDVAWARKVKHSDRVAELVHDEKRDIRILDDEFGPQTEKAGHEKPAAEKPAQTEKPVETPPDMPADISEDLQRYLETAENLRGALEKLGQEGYTRRRQELSGEYTQRITTEEEEERASRVRAIAQFEQFLNRYPNHPRFTPDAMFRLAELYFERSGEEFAQNVKKKESESDTSGLPDYGPSVELYRRLLRDYPRYRLGDGVSYLLGYSLGEMGKEDESRQAFLGLVCNNRYKPLDPPAPWPGRKLKGDPFEGCEAQKGESRFIAETWTRLGEQHFDRGELEAAIAAYSHVLPFTDSPYFDKALYKLAWSFYRADRFADAVRRFDELVVFADKKRTTDEGEVVLRRPRRLPKAGGSTLRSESVQYLALSFAERDWDGDGRADAESGITRLETFYRGRENEPHVREVMVHLGDILFERTEFARAAEAWKRAIAFSPLAPDNPKLQERVVGAYDRLRAFEEALRAREVLARDYGPGSRWHEENKDDAEALASAADLADASLMHAITNRHASAQALRQRALAGGHKDIKLLAQAREGYKQAAESYATYLKQHPQAKNAYEYSYLQAESLFYAGDYAAASAAYAKVREADPKGAHLEEAAYGAVKAQEHVALLALSGGKATDDSDDVSQKLDEKLPPLPAVGKLTPPVTTLFVPPEIEDLEIAFERYVALVPATGAPGGTTDTQTSRLALMAYKAAELDFRYQRFDRARQRFALVLDRYCQSDRAVDAGNAILVSYTIDGNLDQVEAWTNRISSQGCGGKSALFAKQRDSLKKLSEDVSFKKAEQLLDGKHYEAAATMFLAFVEKNSHAENADKALYNAAVAYENLKRWATAGGLYERIARDYQQSPLAEEALFRAAVNQQRLYMFDKALLAYRALATLPRYAKSSHRRDALYNAALLADRDGDAPLGIELWRLYQADPATPPAEANEAAYHAAQLAYRAAAHNAALMPQAKAEWERFMRRVAPQAGNDPVLLGRLCEAYFRIGLADEADHNPNDARDSFAKTVKLGQRLEAGSDQAEFAASAAFKLAEARLAELAKLHIGGGGGDLEQSISRFNSEVTAVIGEYEKVLRFRRATFTLAAYYRMGYATELYAKALLAAPCPPEVRRLGEGACGLYRTKIEENVSQIEEKAVARYAVTIEQAGRLGVGNLWTREARARLSAYRPDRYPLLHDEEIARGLEPKAGMPAAALGGTQGQTLAEAKEALRAQKYENAMVLARQVLAEDERQVAAILVLATAYYHRHKLELASALIGAAQQIDPNSSEAYLLLGLVALARDESEPIAATAAFRRATELDANSGLAWHNLAAQYLEAKNYEQALGAAQRAAMLLTGSGSQGVQLNLGSALRGLGRHAEAAEVYRRILEHDAQYADGYYNLGLLYLDAPTLPGMDVLSQKRAALQNLSRSRELAPEKHTREVAAAIKEAQSAVEREERKQKRKGGP